MTPDRRASIVRERLCLRDGDLWWVKAHKPVKCWTTKDGYQRFTITLQKKPAKVLHVAVHRAVWLLHHGDWPKYGIDHINRDPSDNRIENLRDVPQSVNILNRRTSTGGVWRQGRKWRYTIVRNGRRIFCESFSTRDEALAARRAAEHHISLLPLVC